MCACVVPAARAVPYYCASGFIKSAVVVVVVMVVVVVG